MILNDWKVWGVVSIVELKCEFVLDNDDQQKNCLNVKLNLKTKMLSKCRVFIIVIFPQKSIFPLL